MRGAGACVCGNIHRNADRKWNGSYHECAIRHVDFARTLNEEAAAAPELASVAGAVDGEAHEGDLIRLLDPEGTE